LVDDLVLWKVATLAFEKVVGKVSLKVALKADWKVDVLVVSTELRKQAVWWES